MSFTKGKHKYSCVEYTDTVWCRGPPQEGVGDHIFFYGSSISNPRKGSGLKAGQLGA